MEQMLFKKINLLLKWSSIAKKYDTAANFFLIFNQSILNQMTAKI